MRTADTIIALATPSGTGAIAIIRLSGPEAIAMVSGQFRSVHGKTLADQRTHTVHLGHILDGEKELDEVLVSLFKNPQSYTGEDVVEISCHGSPFIQQEVIQLFLRKGARLANPGEFTLRAFLNGKLDLSQAEAVADLINSENAASHQLAMNQMRGGFSEEIKRLRTELLDFASLIELELDFAEEDVEFANRDQFKTLVDKIIEVLKKLVDSFALGNVIKTGIPVAIIGQPNVGKSTLLNALLKENKAIVSDIAGTTRDAIEDEITIGGIGFRFIDTAGIRETEDVVESIGIQRTFEKVEQSQVILMVLDASNLSNKRIGEANTEIAEIKARFPDKKLLVIVNKMDIAHSDFARTEIDHDHILELSASDDSTVEVLRDDMLEMINTGALRNNESIVTNSRHYDALINALSEMQKVKVGMDEELPSDLMAIDIRQALFHLGEITGEITTDDLLGNIFANFCIGK